MPFTAGTLIVAAAAAAAPIIAGEIAKAEAAGDKEKAAELTAEMVAGYKANVAAVQSLGVPTLGDVNYQSADFTGGYTPEDMQAFLSGPTAYEQVNIDPRLKAAQMNALEQMQKIGVEGLTDEDKAVMNQIQRTAGREDRSRQAAILQNLAQRGMSSSGMELAQRLNSSQAAAEQAAQSADAQGIAAAERKRQAIQAASEIASGARTQEGREQEALASARDAIERFNAQNSQQASQFNAGQGTKAAEYAATGRQNAANSAAEQANLTQTQNIVNKPTSQFNMNLGKTNAVTNAVSLLGGGYNNAATGYNTSATNTQKEGTAIGTGIGTGLAGTAGYINNARPAAVQARTTPSLSESQAASADLEFMKRYGKTS